MVLLCLCYSFTHSLTYIGYVVISCRRYGIDLHPHLQEELSSAMCSHLPGRASENCKWHATVVQ
jgi:hypothetical protein